MKSEKTKFSPAKLLVSILICFVAAAIGSVFTFDSITTWYATLTKPWFTPPNWVFGPVWTILYLLMGISAYMIWNSGSEKKKLALSLFGVQLVLNALWSILFFGLRSPVLGAIEIVALWIAVFATIIQFWKTEKRAALLLLPYIIWITIASALNFSVWMLNP